MVKYKDLDYAVKTCLKLKKQLDSGLWEEFLDKKMSKMVKNL